MRFSTRIKSLFLPAFAGIGLAPLAAAPSWSVVFESISTASVSHQTVTVLVPKTGMSAAELAVIVNDRDPQSVAVAEYYRVKRNIPDANMIHVNFSSVTVDMSTVNFIALRAQIDAALSASIQGIAVSWTLPWGPVPIVVEN